MESSLLQLGKSIRNSSVHTFFSINTEVKVVNRLEETTYYQASCGVKNYLNEFQTLIFDTNYINSHTIVINFRRGLQTIIQNQITIFPIEYSEDTNLTI